MSFSMFTKLCSHHHYIILECFHYSEKKNYTHQHQHFLYFPPHNPNLPSVCGVVYSGHSNNGIIQCVAFCDWLFFGQHNVFKVHSCCSMKQYLITFYGWIIVHYMGIYHILFVHLSVDEIFGLFPSSDYCEQYCCKIHVQVFV